MLTLNCLPALSFEQKQRTLYKTENKPAKKVYFAVNNFITCEAKNYTL